MQERFNQSLAQYENRIRILEAYIERLNSSQSKQRETDDSEVENRTIVLRQEIDRLRIFEVRVGEYKREIANLNDRFNGSMAQYENRIRILEAEIERLQQTSQDGQSKPDSSQF